MKAANNVLSAGKTGTAGKAIRTGKDRLDLARLPWLRPLIESRWPLLLARALTLAGFVFTILVGLFGSPVGSHNFAIIFVWIAWWTALKLFFIPLGGRSWCSVCPLPMPGEWLQQGGLIAKARQRLGLGLRWPRRLRGNWLQASLFLVIGLFSAVTLTDPRVTAWVLLGLILLAVVLSLVYERRAFCTYVCPIGGFTGIYAQTAPVELRVVDASLCAAHAEKTCYLECPWGLYPLGLRDSSQCGLCMECLRVCPQDNIALNLRPFSSDLGAPRRSQRLDEAFLALVMLGSALAFSAVFTGSWGVLKNAALAIGSLPWLGYAAAFLTLNLALLPAAFALTVWLAERDSQRPAPLRRALASWSQVLLPLGLFSWIAFTVSFALPKFSYIINALSDPLGRGWSLLGSTEIVVNADKFNLAPFLQLAALLVGLYWSVNLAASLARAGVGAPLVWRKAAPLAAFSLLYTVLMMGLLLG
ncbi:MAG TPA: 4Fe-4S binding protein [Anaerolineales bacterium]|nr:4Fe-4S binding protein [Anaerolineales bacterium]